MKLWLRRNPFIVLLVPLVVLIIVVNNRYGLSAPVRIGSERAEACQKKLAARYEELGIEGQELAIIESLTLGYRAKMDRAVKRSYAASGAMHVLAVSGLHTGIVMAVLMALMTCFGYRKPLYEEKGKRIAQSVIMVALLAGYAFITGGNPPVVRSVVMASLYLWGKAEGRNGSTLNIIFAAAFLILAFSPADLYSVSFQLSFAAVIAIVVFMEGWNNLLPKTNWNKPWKWLSRVLWYLYELTGISIAAQIGVLPFTLHYFGQMSNYFMLTNMVVVPLAWVLMALAIATLTIGWWMPIGTGLAWLMSGVAKVMNSCVGWIEDLPFATTSVQLPLYGFADLVAISVIVLIVWNRITQQQWTWR